MHDRRDRDRGDRYDRYDRGGYGDRSGLTPDEEFAFGGLRKSPTGRKCRLHEFLDFKDVPSLRRFVTAQGKLFSRKRAGTCAKCQRVIKAAVKRARLMAILGYTG